MLVCCRHPLIFMLMNHWLESIDWLITWGVLQITLPSKQCMFENTLYTKILEVNLFTFAYRLFHEDFSSIDGETVNKQSVGKCKQINF